MYLMYFTYIKKNKYDKYVGIMNRETKINSSQIDSILRQDV